MTKQGLKVLLVSLHQPLLRLCGLLYQGEHTCVCGCCEFCRKMSLRHADDVLNSMLRHYSRPLLASGGDAGQADNLVKSVFIHNDSMDDCGISNLTQENWSKWNGQTMWGRPAVKTAALVPAPPWCITALHSGSSKWCGMEPAAAIIATCSCPSVAVLTAESNGFQPPVDRLIV